MALNKQLIGTAETVVCCPGCGFDYLHHNEVEVFCRETEDAQHGVHVLVNGRDNTVRQDTGQAGNPSSRRDGVRIRLACEGCEATTEFTLAQHKGRTYVQLIAVPPDAALEKIKTQLAGY